MKEKTDFVSIESQIEDCLAILKDAVITLNLRIEELQKSLLNAHNKLLYLKGDEELVEMGTIHILD